MSTEFWTTVLPSNETRYEVHEHIAGHGRSLISPSARGSVESSSGGVCLYTKDSYNRPLSVRAFQLRVAKTHNAVERFLPAPLDFDVFLPSPSPTGHRATVTIRQLDLRDTVIHPCFDWWINRHASHLPLSLDIETGLEKVLCLSSDRFGDSLVSLTLRREKTLNNTQIKGVLPSVQTLRLVRIGKVTADDLLPFPNLEQLEVKGCYGDVVETRVNFGARQTPNGATALTPFHRLQHLCIKFCFDVRLPDLPKLFPRLQSFSVHRSRLQSPFYSPPEMPLLTHLDLFVQNPEIIRRFPHCPNLRLLALPNLDITALRTILREGQSLRHLEGSINSAESFDVSRLEAFIEIVEELHIRESLQLRNLTFGNSDSLVNLRTLNLFYNTQLATLDVSACFNLKELVCSSCSQLREVVGLAGLRNIEELRVDHNAQLTTLDISGCINLKQLDCDTCLQLREIVGLAGLESIEKLRINEISKLTTLDVSRHINLRELQCQECRNVHEIVGLVGLKKLETLHVQGNSQLKVLDVSGCVSLRELQWFRCPQLDDVIGLDEHPALKQPAL